MLADIFQIGSVSTKKCICYLSNSIGLVGIISSIASVIRQPATR
jgi:hypothetical protein